ncbi:histidine kinase [Shewanella halifaxensis HAW-EB4]|uniref:histidine kinase n=1 Tax=Shewanella halifaxensis (strain HAW-EB4) TaxID=458817 RepID=B0TSY4_SHEHH|nr:sensor histidine kinase [Shewanella halifaxensis]ABZ76545.1 histidine kinase [Shewanella halifaxensis HAW-EB4]
MYIICSEIWSKLEELISIVLIAVITLLALQSQAWASLQSSRIGLNSGLEEDIILALLIDHQDFMWVGTKNGLFVYDGYQVQKHIPYPSTPNSISALDIRNIYQSSDHTIWVSTNSGGLNKYVPQTNTFTHYRHQSDKQNSISNDSVYDVVEDVDGQLWIATQIGLNRLNRITGEITRFYHDADDPTSLPNDYVYRLFLDSNKRLWLGTIGAGLAYWDAVQQEFVQVALPNSSHDDIFAITEDAQQNLWLGSRNGLLKMNPLRDTVEQIYLTPSSKKQPLVINLHLTQKNTLAIGTSGYGLMVLDLANNTLVSGNERPNAANSTVTSIVENSQSTLFVGTWGAGLQRINAEVPYVTLIDNANSNTLPTIRNVSALFTDQANNKTWVGTLGTGLHWLDHDSQQILKVESSLSLHLIEGIHSITQLGADQLYVGTSQGLWHLSTQGKTLAFFKHDTTHPNSIGKGYVRVIEPALDGNLWIGIGGTGLHHFNPNTEKFTAYRHDSTNKASISGDYITSLLVDGDEIWVGTRSSGLNRCQTLVWVCKRFQPNSAEENPLSHFYVTDLVRDSKLQIWVGTDGGGLSKILFDTNNRVLGFQAVSEQLGSVGQSILSITPELDGNLWLTTKKGISFLNPSQQTAFNLGDEQLFHVGSFSQNASSQSVDHSYFGAINGVISIERNRVISPELPAPIKFTKIEHESLPLPLMNMGIANDLELSLPWGKVLTLEFSLLDFSEKTHDYEYRLTPSSPWQPLNNRKHMTFFKMEPGLHQIEVKGKGNNGQWSDPAKLNVKIVPPWWMKTSVRIASITIIIMMFIAFHKMRLARWQKHTARLQALQAQKQVALDEVENREQQLSTAYQGLRSLASQIQNAKEEERKSISRELHDQFGQTLTATKINLQLYKKFNYQEQERIESAISITHTMIQQMRSISFNLRPALLDDEGLVAGVKLQLEKMSALIAKPIKLSVSRDFPMVNQGITINVFRIIQESVNNAIRHANASQIIVSLSYHSEQLFIEIKDDGKGFDVDKVKENTFSGVHLGLLGMEERVHSLSGKLLLHSSISNGSIIKVVIPNV